MLVPDGPEVVRRHRLLSLLGRTEVTVVVGPAGYGKTTLLADWARRTPSTAWLTLSAADADPVRLLLDLTEALRASCTPQLATPGVEVRTPYDSLEPPSQDEALDTFVATLHDQLAMTRQPVTVVFDDVHVLTGATRSLSLLDSFIQAMPVGLRVLLSARQLPQIRLTRLELSGRLTVIDADALAFTPAETAAVLTPPGTEPDRDRVAAAQRATQGWPVAVRMCAIAASAGSGVDIAGGGTASALTDYLVAEVLDTVDADLRALIVDACVDDVVCADLLDTVRGRGDSAALLERCYRAGLFLTVEHNAGDGAVWYTWHQVFAAHVRGVADHEDPIHVRELHARAAMWWRHVDAVAAVEHALRAGRPELGAELAADMWPELVLAGLASTVVRLVHQLPPGLEYEAELSLALAFADALRGDRARSRSRLSLARASAGRLPDENRLRFDARAEALSIQYLVTDLKSLQEGVDRGHDLLRQLEDGPWVPDPVTLTLTRLCVGMGEARLQRHNQTALRLLQSAADLAQERGLTAVHLVAVGETCIPTIATGELDVAAAAAERVLEAAAAKGWGVPSALAPALAYTGWFAFWRGDLDGSIARLGQVKQLLHDADTALRGLTSYFLAQAYVYSGRAEDGRRELDDMRSVTGSGLMPPYWPSILAAVEAELLLAEGRTVRAREHASRRVGDRQYRLASTARARVLLRAGDPASALAVLDEVPAEEHFVNVTVLVQRLRAEALFRLERHAEAQHALDVALDAGERFGLVLPFLVDKDAMRPLLRTHLAVALRPDLAREVLARLGDDQDDVPSSGLTVRELSVLRHLATNMTLNEIAETQSLSANTIKSQVTSVYRKLEVRSRREAVRAALDRGLI